MPNVVFLARLNSTTQKPAYDLTLKLRALFHRVRLSSRPFAARIKAVLHGAGDMTPTLPARMRECSGMEDSLR